MFLRCSRNGCNVFQAVLHGISIGISLSAKAVRLFVRIFILSLF